MGKKLLLLLLVPAVLLLVGYLYLRLSLKAAIGKEQKKEAAVQPIKDTLGDKKLTTADLRPLFIQRLQQVIRKSSNGLYDFSVEDMKVDVLSSSVSLQNVTLRPNAQVLQQLKQTGVIPDNSFTVSLKSLLIEGINLDDAINSKSMDYQLLRLVQPVIYIQQHKQKQQATKNDEAFTQDFLKQMKKLDIKNLVVENGTIISQDQKGRQTMRINGVQINMADILLDSSTRTDPNRFLFARKAMIRFRNYHTKTKDGLYHLNIGDVTVNAPQQQVRLGRLLFASPLGKEQFAKKQSVAKEWYRLSLSSITLNKINWWTLFNGKEIIAEELSAGKGKLAIYFDRSLPPRSRMGNFPNQLLMKIPAKINIARLKIRDLDLSYEEYNPVSQQKGTVYLDKVKLDAVNLSNLKTNHTKPFIVSGTALFMHQIPLQAKFSFSMANHRSGQFEATIKSSDAFEADLLNPFAMPLGMMKIEKGTLHEIDAQISGDELQAVGEVLMRYKDLKISLLEKDPGKTKLDKKDFTSLIANAIILKKENPKDNGIPKKEDAQFKRVPEAGFVMLVWKTVLVGALKTIGAPEKMATKKTGTAQKN